MLLDIQEILSDHPWKDKILWLDTIDSTNTYAKQLARDGAPEGTVVIADQQTGGRGRLGRSFSSPAGVGIYMSVILRPDCLPGELMHLTCAAGLFSCLAVENAAPDIIPPRIKWANDLVLGSRKLGGILTELSVDPISRKVEWAVIGIGINCCQADFPEEIRQIAISLGISPAQRLLLMAELVRAICNMRQHLFSAKEGIMDAFRHRCITIGQHISILQGDTIRHGRAVDVTIDGGLVVSFPDGHQETVTSGEVSIRGMYGYV